jgi:hypothetical protein
MEPWMMMSDAWMGSACLSCKSRHSCRVLLGDDCSNEKLQKEPLAFRPATPNRTCCRKPHGRISLILFALDHRRQGSWVRVWSSAKYTGGARSRFDRDRPWSSAKSRPLPFFFGFWSPVDDHTCGCGRGVIPHSIIVIVDFLIIFNHSFYSNV